jgi:small subunit ribosomal protein S6
MAKISEKYELMLVLNTKQDEDKIKELVEKFKALIETEGTVSEINTWGKRKLAYEINDETEGYYVLYTFEAKPELPKELERVLKITDGVLRSLVTVA